ncbi:MAG: ferredoxin-NADP(+) reductase subunit alpha [candidate division NC10 bacterium]|nr:ferredoxin-NADP(+) reductase subunit alpha [candidate division NC10 bacterium]
MFRIVEKLSLAATITKYVVEAPFIARKRKAGNFVMLRIDEHGERIPITIADSDPARGTITLIVQAVGKTTRHLSTLSAGDSIRDVVGPLGNPTPIESFGRVVCVGGGVGTAELYPIARALHDAGNEVVTIIGGRTRDLVILEKEMRSCSGRVIVTTDDGSYGRQGIVTDPLREVLEEPAKPGAVYAIGPLPMMKAVSETTRPYGVQTLVSLNTVMVDGTGMCGGCRVTVGGRMKFACVDGPEFDGHQVDFGELMMRNRTYADMEKLSNDRHQCKLQALAAEAR